LGGDWKVEEEPLSDNAIDHQVLCLFVDLSDNHHCNWIKCT
jgi:hypothetical protein